MFSRTLERQTVPIQTRQRHVLQEALYGGRACPKPLTEVRRCNNYSLCEGLYWALEPWSPCALPPDRMPPCGPGLQVRGEQPHYIFCDNQKLFF